MSIPKKNRLSLKESKEHFLDGQGYQNIFLKIIFKKNTQSNPRFAVLISKKKQSSSVKRHSLRRKIQNILYQNQYKLPIGDYLVILKQVECNTTTKELTEYIMDLISKFKWTHPSFLSSYTNTFRQLIMQSSKIFLEIVLLVVIPLPVLNMPLSQLENTNSEVFC